MHNITQFILISSSSVFLYKNREIMFEILDKIGNKIKINGNKFGLGILTGLTLFNTASIFILREECIELLNSRR